MMGRTHLSIGVLLLFALDRYTEFVGGNELLASILILVAAILPDIDHSSSIVGRKFRFVSWAFRHRGFFHSLFAMVFFTVLIQLLFFERSMSIVFMLGYASHLFADSITKEGTTLFYPRKMKIKGPLVVGSFAETLFFLGLVVLSVYLII